ncbi:hypothetical protein M9H77_14439 [Catharanthus roseus]|uniref:Uncharacterized protein n=1 Tax=Catharanthus roseus TaxID=4058 RepID=A0ACC0BN24_CATRO|nr:hypothetical protein M9H77_14439 [Catharanthus roseus]
MRDLMGDIQKDGKQPPWIKERHWQAMLDYWKSTGFLTLSQQNKKNRNEGRGEGDPRNTQQAILVEKFSKSKELEELHKHHLGRRRCRFYLRRLLEEILRGGRKAEKEAVAMGTAVPDNLAHMAIVAGGADVSMELDWRLSI